jgi:hypothetical protein
VDLYPLIAVRSGCEFMRGVGRDDENLPGAALHLLGADGERCPSAADDEGFGVGMLV